MRFHPIDGQPEAESRLGALVRRLTRRFVEHGKGRSLIWQGLLGVLFWSRAAALSAADKEEGFDFFEARIRPLLIERCYKCHSQQSEKIKGGLLLDTKDAFLKGGENGPVLKPGNPGNSRFIEAVSYENPDLQMPPKEKLSANQIADLIHWVKMGAPDPRVARPEDAALTKIGKSGTFWAFLPLKKPPLPKVQLARWIQTPIDNFILPRLEKAGLAPSPPADKQTLIRRATYDLTGLPPTAEEVDEFLQDRSKEAFARVVNRLLASPRYGERWGRYWLDLARYSDTKGYVYDREERRFVHADAYRDWVIRAFNQDLPYDQFLLEQLAADRLLIPGSSSNSFPQNLAAMGFLTLGRRFLGVTHDIIDDRIDVVTRTAMGLTVSCARCHDHKFDPISTRDYYSLYGIFNGSREKLVPLASLPEGSTNTAAYQKGLQERESKLNQAFAAKRDDVAKRGRAKAGEYLEALLQVDKLPSEEFYTIMSAEDLNPVIVRQWQNYLYQHRHGMDSVFGPWHAFSRLGEKEFASQARAVSKSLVENSADKINQIVLELFAADPPLSMREVAQRYGKLFAAINRKYQAAPKGEPAADRAATQGESHSDRSVISEKELREVLFGGDAPVTVPAGPIVDVEWFFEENSRVELAKLQAEIERWILSATGAPPHAVILEDRPAAKKARVFIRGNPSNKGEEVPPLFLPSFPGLTASAVAQGSGRLEMARSISSKKNPLTSRVMVNRIWLHHFGAGLVRTPSDFGTRSEPPTHPELLDYLAVRFMDEGWSIKNLHRLIMLSAVYQQRSDLETSLPVPPRRQQFAKKADAVPTRAAGTGSPHDPGPAAAGAAADPENRLLSRMNSQRLDFEALRDSLLAVSGELDLSPGGKSVELFGRAAANRRTVFGFIDRQFLPGVLRTFDFANPDAHSPERHHTTVPQQALFLMNNRFMLDRARALTHRIDSAGSIKPKEKIQQFYRLVYQRLPRPPELESGLAFLEKVASDTPPVAPPPPPPVWQYGYGEFDAASGRMAHFTPLPHFTGTAWQAGPDWPDAHSGRLQLTGEGGHPGSNGRQAAVRRWIARRNATLIIKGTIQHGSKDGDGIQAKIVSSARGSLGAWKIHNGKQETQIPNLPVSQGEFIDFVVEPGATAEHDSFSWAPILSELQDAAQSPDELSQWDAKKDFEGPIEAGKPLSPWEKYAQVLLLSNEFTFID